MRFFNFSQDKKQQHTRELKRRVDEGAAVLELTKSPGWAVVQNLFTEQLDAYKAEVLLGCRDWNEYLDKRSKAFAISLLNQDIEDFIRMGTEAAAEIDSMKVDGS